MAAIWSDPTNRVTWASCLTVEPGNVPRAGEPRECRECGKAFDPWDSRVRHCPACSERIEARQRGVVR
jgi:hypothetical protein